MLAAASAATSSVDTTVFAAFAVGFVSFISPCVLPLVPGYLSAISGVTIDEMRGDQRKVGKVLGPAIIFCLSFTIMFVALGMSATGIGSTLHDHQDTLNRIAGWLIVVLGVFFVCTLFIPRFNREWRPEALISRAGAGGPVIAGLAFAVAWTPCVGPTLASILAAASTSDTVGKGGLLLAFYSLGLAIPFLVTAVAFDRATTAFRWLRDRHVLVTAISGAVLIVMGALILSGELTTLNAKAQHGLSSLGLDFLYNL
jgi:cytochrome c-type biogenesis protein